MSFDTLIDAVGSHLPLLPEVREMTLFGICGQVSQVPEECYYLTSRTPPRVQVEYISGYMNCPLEFWGFGVPFGPEKYTKEKSRKWFFTAQPLTVSIAFRQ